MIKTTRVAILFFGVMLVGDWLYLKRVYKQSISYPNDLQVYSLKQLNTYDGSEQDKPILLALDGYVYDVSSGRNDFYGPGEVYHELAGKDASISLAIFGGSIIKDKYKVVGVLQK